MNKMPFYLVRGAFFVLFLCVLSESKAQINCPECNVGVCPNVPVSNLLTGDLSQFLSITQGAILNTGGDPANPADWTLQNNANQLIIEYQNGTTENYPLTFLEDVYPNLVFSQNAGCHNYTFTGPDDQGLGWTYTWTIRQTVQGTDSIFSIGSSSNFNYTFPFGGDYNIALTISNGNCLQSFSFPLQIGNEAPTLAFFSETGASLNVNNQYQISYCGVSQSTTISVLITGFDNGINPFQSFIVEMEGIEVFNSSDELPSNFALIDNTDNAQGVYEIEVTVIDMNGCEYVNYYTLIVSNVVNLTISSSFSFGCSGDEVEITPASNDYEIGQYFEYLILCGNQELEQYTFLDTETIPDQFNWLPQFSSCECENSPYPNVTDGNFGVVMTADHPCNAQNEPLIVPIPFNYGIIPDASFTVFPSDTICLDPGTVDLNWNQLSEANSGPSGCQLNPQWEITDSLGNVVFNLDGTTNATYTFENPGVYEVNHTLNSLTCGGDESYISICVNPTLDIIDLALLSAPNGIDPFCSPGPLDFPIEFDPDLLFCDPLTLNWSLTGTGTISNSSGGVNMFTPGNLDFGNLTLSPGEYELQITASIADCDDETWTYNFTVWGEPDVYLLPDPETNCVGEPTDFGAWFCIRDSLETLDDLEIVLYEASDCDNLGDVVESWDDDSFLSLSDPCNFNSNTIVWDSTLAGTFALVISATNACGTDVECIWFEVQAPEPLEFVLNDDHCVGDVIDLYVQIIDGPDSIPTFSQGEFTFGCPPSVTNCPGPIDANNPFWNTANLPDGQYTITYSLECYEQVQFTVNLRPNPEINFVPDFYIICSDQGFSLPDNVNDPPLDSCAWEGPNGFDLTTCDLNIPSPVEPGFYTLVGATEFGCLDTDSIQINVEQFDITGALPDTCENQSFDLNTYLQIEFFGSGSFQDVAWEVCEANDPSNCQTVTPNFSDNLSLLGFEEGEYTLNWAFTSPPPLECNYAGSIPFTITPLDDVDLGDDSQVCIGDTVQIPEPTDSDGALGGEWTIIDCPGGVPCNQVSNNGDFELFLDPDIYEPGDYEILYSGNCIDSDNIIITVIENPEFQIDAPSTICQGDNVTLSTDYTDATEYSWTSEPSQTIINSNQQNASVEPQVDSEVTYTLNIFDNGCSGADSVTVEIDTQPWINFSDTIVFCDNQITCLNLDSVLLSNGFDSPLNEAWAIDGVGNVTGTTTCVDLINLDPNIYDVIVTYESSIPCPFSDTLVVQISELEELTAQLEDTALCVGDTLNPQFQSTLPNFDSSEVSATLTICDGSPCNTPITLPWDTSNEPPGSYQIVFEGVCLEADTLDITIFPIPDLVLSSTLGTPICPDTTTTLNVSSNSAIDSCFWASNDPTEILVATALDCSQMVSPDSAATYTATIFSNGCENSSSIDISVLINPFPLSCEALAQPYCINDTTCISFQSLLANGDATDSDFTWYLDEIESPNLEICLDTISDGTHYIWYDLDLNGCSFSDSCSFTIDPNLTPLTVEGTVQANNSETLTNGDTLTICMGDAIALESNSTENGIWNLVSSEPTGSTCPPNFTSDALNLEWNTDIGVDCPGVYGFQFSAVCIDTTVIYVQVFPNPEAEIILPGDTVCAEDSVTVEVIYNGQYPVDSVVISGPNLTGAIEPTSEDGDTLFIWEFDPGILNGTYQVYLEDSTICPYQNTFEIYIQEAPFETMSCPISDEPYCTNDTTCIQLQSLLPNEDITLPGFTWWLDDSQLSTFEICLDSISDGTHYIWYDYLDLNDCSFSDSCSFTIDPALTPLSLDGTVETNNSEILTDGDTLFICMGDAITLESNSTENGVWNLVSSGPAGSTCPPNFTSDALNLEWNTEIGVDCPGVYGFQFSAVCIDTTVIYVQVFPNPEVEVILPGDTVCAEDSVTVEVIYNGQYPVDSVAISGPNLTGAIEPTSEEGDTLFWEFEPGILNGTYDIYLEDSTICPYEGGFTITIQDVDFFLAGCSALDGQYCSNSDIDLDLQNELISGTIPPGEFTWYIVDQVNDTTDISDGFNPSDYESGDYLIYYDFVHGESPNCVFSDTCAFTINDLDPVTVDAEVGYCLQDTSTILVIYDDQFSGSWEILDSPGENCLDVSLENSTTFEFTPNCLGDYTIMFSGNCLDTVIVEFEVLSIPVAQWTPADLSPCLNECFEFEPDILQNATDSYWTYNGQVETSPLCFEDGDPGTLCLVATREHIVEGETITCTVEDCEVLDPIESPGGVLDIPYNYCSGDTFEIAGDWVEPDIFNEYDDCEFTFPPFPNADCGSIIEIDENGPYGNYDYTLVLSYGETCKDSIEGEIFIPEPPSASLLIEYDSCVANIEVALPGLSGDSLSFDWGFSFYEDDTVDASSILTNQTSTLPEPNPILLSNLNLTVDSAFIVDVTIFNEYCIDFDHYTLELDTAGLYVAPPDLNIDIVDTSGVIFCTPAELSFQAFVSTTQFIDSVSWSISSSQSDMEIYSFTNESTEPTDYILFENFQTVTDTITIEAIAYGRCGEATAEEEIYIVSDSVFVKIPDSLSGACGGQSVTFEVLEIFGVIDTAIITADPNIPGLNFTVSQDYTTYTVNIPESTLPDEYELILYVEGCGNDSDFTNIEVYPDPDVGFEVTETGCTDDEIFFTNLTEGATSFEWDFGDGAIPDEDNELVNPIHVYNAPGTFYPTLTATSANGCVAETEGTVFIYGPNPNFVLEENKVCHGDPVSYELPENENIIDIKWEFLLAGVDTILSAADTNTFIILPNETDTIQSWLLTLTLTDEVGCTAENDTMLHIFPVPVASFTHSRLDDCALGEAIRFDNFEQNGISYQWNFGDPESGFLNQVFGSDPEHIFSGPGEYTVSLTAATTTLNPRCENRTIRVLRCDNLSVFVPNAFTPDENGVNDVFKPVIYGIEDIVFEASDYYSFEIYDRWGRVIWETDDPDRGWNGQSPNDDYYSRSDMYNWRLEIKFPDETKEWVGSVTLLK